MEGAFRLSIGVGDFPFRHPGLVKIPQEGDSLPVDPELPVKLVAMTPGHDEKKIESRPVIRADEARPMGTQIDAPSQGDGCPASIGGTSRADEAGRLNLQVRSAVQGGCSSQESGGVRAATDVAGADDQNPPRTTPTDQTVLGPGAGSPVGQSIDSRQDPITEVSASF